MLSSIVECCWYTTSLVSRWPGVVHVCCGEERGGCGMVSGGVLGWEGWSWEEGPP